MTPFKGVHASNGGTCVFLHYYNIYCLAIHLAPQLKIPSLCLLFLCGVIVSCFAHQSMGTSPKGKFNTDFLILCIF